MDYDNLIFACLEHIRVHGEDSFKEKLVAHGAKPPFNHDGRISKRSVEDSVRKLAMDQRASLLASLGNGSSG